MNKKEIRKEIISEGMYDTDNSTFIYTSQEIDLIVGKLEPKINYTRCCTELKDKKPLTFKEWKKVNKYTICTDETWFVSPEVGYITTKELKKRYKKHYNL